MTREEQIINAAYDEAELERQLKMHPQIFEQGFVAGAKWADEHPTNLWKDARGDDLPMYDREVVVLIQDYPDDEEHLRVAIGHRPNPNEQIKVMGKAYTSMVFGKGCWNLPNVKYWLDVELPNQD